MAKSKITPVQNLISWLDKKLKSSKHKCTDHYKWSEASYSVREHWDSHIMHREKEVEYCSELKTILQKDEYKNLLNVHLDEIADSVLIACKKRHGGNIWLIENLWKEIRESLFDGQLEYDDIENKISEFFRSRIKEDYKDLSKELSRVSKILTREYGSGPEQCREEVTGLSTKGSNKNSGNSGFSGGTMARLAAA